MKRTVDLAAIVEYTVTPAYKTRSDKASLLAALAKRRQATTAKKARKDIIEAEDWVPDKLEIQAVMLDESLKKKESFLSVTIPDPVPRDLDKYYLKSEPVPPAVNLSTDSAADIAELKGIGPVYAALIVSKQPYRRYEQLAEAAPGIRRSTIDDLIAAGHVRLF